MKERWLPVVGHEGIYEVSDLGNVRSQDRIDFSGFVRRGLPMRVSFLKSGYPRVTLTKRGIERTRKVHQLVLEAFDGPCPHGMEACHRNGNPSDSRLFNLRWGTKASNCADKITHGTMYQGERHHSARLTFDSVRAIRMSDEPLPILADRHGITVAAVWKIRHRKAWKHVA